MTANHVQSVQESRLFRFNLNDSQSPLTFAGQRMDDVCHPYTTATSHIVDVNPMNSVNSIQQTQQPTFTPVNIAFDPNWLNNFNTQQPLRDEIDYSDESDTDDDDEFDSNNYNQYSRDYYSSSSLQIKEEIRDIIKNNHDIDIDRDCLYNYIFIGAVKNNMWNICTTINKYNQWKPVFNDVYTVLKESEKYNEDEMNIYDYLCDLIYGLNIQNMETVLNYAYDCFKKSNFNDIYYAICVHIKPLWKYRNFHRLTIKNKTTLALLYAKTHGIKLFQFISLMRIMDSINVLYDKNTEMNAETMFMVKHVINDIDLIKNINEDIWYYLKNDAFKFNYETNDVINHKIWKRIKLNEEIKLRNPISPITPEKMYAIGSVSRKVITVGNSSHLYTRCILDDVAYDSLLTTLIEDIEDKLNEIEDETQRNKLERMRMEIDANSDNRSIIIKRFITPFVLKLNKEKIIKSIHNANEMIKMIKYVNFCDACQKYDTWYFLFRRNHITNDGKFTSEDIDGLKKSIEDMKRALSFWY